jgi:hypothetical protein
MGKNYLDSIKKDFLGFHEKLIVFSSFLQNESSKKKPETTTNHLAVSALTRMHSDLICIHRAILTLCKDGWPFIVPVLVRTMLDIILSAAVIANADEPSYMGFKYFFLGFKQRLTESDVHEEEKTKIREELDRSLEILNDDAKEKARGWFYRGRLLTYWFSPEFARPNDVIEAYASPEIQWLYKKYSGSTHGGFIGLSLLRQESDRIDINPRQDKGATLIALSGSCRIVLEFFRLRNIFEALYLDDIISDLTEEFGNYGSYVSSMQPVKKP